VRGLLHLEDGAVFAVVRAHLEHAGYTLQHELLDAASVLPQTRVRLFIVGFRSDLPGDVPGRFVFPDLPDLGRGVRDILEDEASVPARCWLTEHQWGKVKSQPYFEQHPEARVVVPSSPSTTLQSSYKSGYMLYSQFVPATGAAAGTKPPRFYTPR